MLLGSVNDVMLVDVHVAFWERRGSDSNVGALFTLPHYPRTRSGDEEGYSERSVPPLQCSYDFGEHNVFRRLEMLTAPQ